MLKHVAMTPGSILVGLVSVGLFLACSSTKSGGTGGASGTGGTIASGGNSATGGMASSGGATASAGNTASGGSSVTGGASSTGRTTVAGGNTASGGSNATGGGATSGGSTGTGGNTASGGSSATGGASSSGGSTGTGGNTASGGSSATGGLATSGGTTAAGGSSSTGGSMGGSPDAGSIDARARDASGGGKDVVAMDGLAGAVEVARDTSTAQSDVAASVSFKTQILPMLQANCVSCHGPTKQNSGVRVDTYANVSANLAAVTDVLVNGGMPPTGPLPDADRQLFQTWVDQGALNN